MILALSAAAQQQRLPQPRPQPPQQEPEQQPVQREEVSPIQPQDPVQRIGEPEAEAPPETGQGEYRGPTILSRGAEASVSKGNRLLDVRPFATVEGIYETGLATLGVDAAGNYRTSDAYGVRSTFGARGAHSWRRTVLALDYRGDVRHYNTQTYYDGSDHTLLLSVDHRLSRRWTFALSEAAASFNRGFFLPVGSMNMYDPNFAALPTNELFDTRTNALFSQGQAVYQHTARLSFAMSGAGFLVRRRAEGLAGLNGWMAQGDISYRLSRYTTIGVDYAFTRFDFLRTFGDSALHSIGVNYATRLSRYWEVRLRVGGYQVETSRLRQVTLDPAVAAILGRTTGIEAFHGTTQIPAFSGQLVRSFRRSNFTAGYRRAVSPGNGLFLTANADSADVAFSTQLSRRTDVYVGTGMNRYRGLSQTIGEYRSYNGGGGVTVRLAHSLSLLARFNLRSQQIRSSNYDRGAYRVSVGIGWTPGEYPLSIW